MADVITDDGRELVEDIAVGASDTALHEIAVGAATSSPSTSDTSMYNEIYASTDENITMEKLSATGVLRFTITVTGGTEVPADTELTEFGIFAADGRMFYHEVRSSPITVDSGEKKVIEIRTPLQDNNTDDGVALTDAGLDEVANMLLGNSGETMNTIAVGQSTLSDQVDSGDTSMFDELFRAADSEPEVTVSSTSTPGEIDATITMSAGSKTDDEVASDSDISEFGVLTDGGTLVLHEIRPTVTLQANDTKTFKIPFTIVQ